MFNSVTVISPTDVWAVGGLGNGAGQLIEHFNGTSWSVVASPVSGDGRLVSISAVNANDIFAVGSIGEGEPGASTLQFNGTTWSAVANGPTGKAASNPSTRSRPPTSGRWARRRSGTSTGRPGPRSPTVDGQLTAVSGSSANDVYVVGEGDLVEQWNGTSFNVVSATGTAGFTGVATLSNGTAFAVGGNGIETNATTAAPAVSVAKPGGSVSGTVAHDHAAATKSASSDSGVVPDAVAVPPAVATTTVGTLEDPSSTLGTRKHGFTS